MGVFTIANYKRPMVSHLLRHIRDVCEPLHECSHSHTSDTSKYIVGLKTEDTRPG